MPKARVMRSILSIWWKLYNEGARHTSVEKEFHNLGAATENAQTTTSPKLLKMVELPRGVPPLILIPQRLCRERR